MEKGTGWKRAFESLVFYLRE